MYLVESGNTKIEARRTKGAVQTRRERGILGWAMEMIVNLAGGAWAASRSAKPRRMKVLETLAIGPKKQLLMVSCDGQKYLVGTGPESVQTIVRMGRAKVPVTGLMAAELGERN
jgi:hypothetical protein